MALLLAVGACTATAPLEQTGEQSSLKAIEIDEEAPGPKCSDANATWECHKETSTLDCRGAEWGDPCHGDGYCNSSASQCELIGETPAGAAICRCPCVCDFEEEEDPVPLPGPVEQTAD